MLVNLVGLWCHEGWWRYTGSFSDLDRPGEAISLAEGAVQLKVASGSNTRCSDRMPHRPSASDSRRRGTRVAVRRGRHGLRLEQVAVWAAVLREDMQLGVDKSGYFTSDRLAIRSTMCLAFGFAHEASIVKITVG